MTNFRSLLSQYQIWQEFSQVTERCITSKLRIYHTQSRRYRSVWHLRYCEWVEQNCPKDVGQFSGRSNEFLVRRTVYSIACVLTEFLEELSSVRLASINEVPPGHNTNPPVLIHCSEGGGRAGVTLSADLLLYTLDHNQVCLLRTFVTKKKNLFVYCQGSGHTTSCQSAASATRQYCTIISSI